MNPKVNVARGSGIFATHLFIMIHPCTKYGMPISKQTEVFGRTLRHKYINLTLESKFDLIRDLYRLREMVPGGRD